MEWDLDEFSNRLFNLRMQLALSQAKFAKLIDFHRVYIHRYERADRDPTAKTVYQICKALGISSDYLLLLTDKEPKLNVKKLRERLNGL